MELECGELQKWKYGIPHCVGLNRAPHYECPKDGEFSCLMPSVPSTDSGFATTLTG